MAKVTKEDVDEMKRLSNQGMSQEKIGKKFGLYQSTVGYHLCEKTNQNVKKKARLYFKNMTKEEKKARNKRRLPYLKKYIMNRYHNDEEFRKKFIQCQMKSQKKRYAIWKLDDSLCKRCGKKKESKFKTCEKCRIRRRKNEKI